MDYARLLELACDEWDLQGFHRATYEYHAKKLRAIAKKYQVGIGYDYDVTVAKGEAKKKKPHNGGAVGEFQSLKILFSGGFSRKPPGLLCEQNLIC